MMQWNDVLYEVDPFCFCIAELHVSDVCVLKLYRNEYAAKSMNVPTLFFGYPKNIKNFNWINEMHRKAVALGAEKIIGPIEGNTWNPYRFAVNDGDSKFFGDVANDPDFALMLEQNGFSASWKYMSTMLLDKNIQPPFITNRYFFESRLQSEFPGPNEIEGILDELFSITSSVFAGNLFYSPISKEHFIQKYLPLKFLIEKGDILLVKDEDRVVALGLGYRDPESEGRNRFVLKTIGRIPDKKYIGIGAWVSEYMYDRFANGNYEEFVQAFMHDDNISYKIAKHYHAKVIKNYALYEKDI